MPYRVPTATPSCFKNMIYAYNFISEKYSLSNHLNKFSG